MYSLYFYRDAAGTGNNYWRWNFGAYANNASHDKTVGNFGISNTTAARSMVISGDHSLSSTARSNTFYGNYPIYIFGLNDGGTATVHTHIKYVRIKFFKIYNGDTLVRDFIPVRKNGVGYLYDRVSGELFGNAAGSGSFSYGDDVTT
jgi:hypothetical protein